MKTTPLIVLFLMTFSVFVQAQTRETRLAPSCGPDEVRFKVKTDNDSHQM